MKYLTPQDILVIHARIIDAIGGSHGIRDTGLLASLAERPKASFGGKEMYSGILEKAAVYLESLVHYHVFVDGNKRTSIAAAARFLFLNGYSLQANNKQIESFVLKAAKEKLQVETITVWLKKHTTKA